MALYQLNQDGLDALMYTNEIALIDFWAEWCAPCKAFGKIYENVSEQFPLIRFAQVNIEQAPELAKLFHVRSIPHLVIFKEGIVIYSEAGTVPESTLLELIHQAQEADVSDIKKKLEEGEE